MAISTRALLTGAVQRQVPVQTTLTASIVKMEFVALLAARHNPCKAEEIEDELRFRLPYITVEKRLPEPRVD